MHKISLITISLLISVSAATQMRFGLYAGFSFYPSTGADRMMLGNKGSSFDRFVANYNALNEKDLTKGLTPFKMIPSIYVGTNFMAKAFYTEIAFNTFHGRSTAEFTNGNKRVLDMKGRDWDVGIGLGISRSKFYCYVVGIMYFGFGDRLDAWMEYPDGTKSFGNENFLNGHYQALRTGTRPGLRLGYSITKSLMLTLACDKLKEGGKYDEYRDVLAGDISTEIVGSDLDNIGVDWGDYINNSSDYILNEKELVKSGWSGLQVRFGIGINIYNAE